MIKKINKIDIQIKKQYKENVLKIWLAFKKKNMNYIK